MSDQETLERATTIVHRHRARQIIRDVFVIAIIVCLVVVAMDNRKEVPVGYVVGDVEAPIWVVIVIAAAAGMVIGWLVRHRPRHRV